MTETAKVLITRLHNMNQSAEECVYCLQNAFIYYSTKLLNNCEAKAKEIREQEKQLTREFIEEARGNPNMRAFISLPGHIERMGGCIEDMVRCTRTKIVEGILFSERATSELTFLLERMQEVLENTGNMILARNTIIGDYIKESAMEISRKANDYATMHEERLIEGSCMPKASPLFLHILDSIKDMARHAREIAEQLT